MSAASWAMQKAVYAALRADDGVKAELGDPPRIFDNPPKGEAYPHVVIGEGRVTPLDGVDGAAEHEIRLQIFSRHAGRREIRRIIDALYDALHEADFAIDGHRLVNIRFVFADIFKRGESDLYQGAARFRAVTQAL